MEQKKSLSIFRASTIGSEHIRLRKNNQDGILFGRAEIRNKECLFGVICDGCTEGLNNEVGAKLLSRFICGEIPLILSAKEPIEEVPNILFERCLDYLGSIAATTIVGTYENFASFVKECLLCTILGFLIYEEKVLIFNAGDGIIVINDSIRRIEMGNKPPYISYNLLNKQELEDLNKVPQSFEASITSLETIEKLAICSDGFREEFVSQLFGHDKEISLQRALNKLSFFKSAFTDDCSVIVVEQKKHFSREKGGEEI